MEKPSSVKSFYVLIMVALVAWGGLLALGAFLGPEFWAPQNEPAATATDQAEQPVKTLARPFDVRKPLIVLASVGLFLGGWALALRGRQKRLQRTAAEAVEQARADEALTAQTRH